MTILLHTSGRWIPVHPASSGSSWMNPVSFSLETEYVTLSKVSKRDRRGCVWPGVICLRTTPFGGRTYLRPAGCSLLGQSICATLTLPGFSSPTCQERVIIIQMRNTLDKLQRVRKAPLSFVILRIEMVLSDWQLHNGQRSQVRCCNLYCVASVDGTKIQGSSVRYLIHRVCQSGLLAKTFACARVYFLAGFTSPIRMFCMRINIAAHHGVLRLQLWASCLSRPTSASSKNHLAAYSVHSSILLVSTDLKKIKNITCAWNWCTEHSHDLNTRPAGEM